ncbi:ABC transporter permease, partial [bacterium]|nr:ABC transporter permease [bacterium]
MGTYFLRRILLMIPTLLGITFICFSIMRFVPGGPVEQALMKIEMAKHGGGGEVSSGGSGEDIEISDEMIEDLKKIYGFDKPFHLAYLDWLKRAVQFDLGESWTYTEPVWDVIYVRFPISLFFGGIGFVLSYLICIPLGVFKAMRHNSMFDGVSSIIVFVGYSIPGWAMGIVLLVIFGGGSYWDVFPLGDLQSS